ncbi:MAG: VWA domain-containing protein [Halieaceae bacterium]|nr:VWA domain-containing protein [Halieaceae bacterium]
MLELQWPWAFYLLPLPLLVWRFWPSAGAQDAALRAPFFEAWRELESSGARRATGSWLAGIALVGIWGSLLLAVARPTWVGEPVTLPASGRDLLLAVDLSGSMQVEDMQVGQQTVTRIAAVKQVVGDFIERRKGDRLGLILFGSNAYVQAPLTFDRTTVKRFLREAQLGFAGRETAIGDAIGLAVKRLRDRPAASRVLILLTDGAHNAGEVEPFDAARLAADNGVKIHTIGIGADQMVRPGIFGSSFGSRVVNPSRDLDERSLRQIANMTGGNYFRARDPAELVNIYELLDALEPVEQEAQSYRPQKSLFHLPLSLAFGLSLLLGFARVLAR